MITRRWNDTLRFKAFYHDNGLSLVEKAQRILKILESKYPEWKTSTDFHLYNAVSAFNDYVHDFGTKDDYLTEDGAVKDFDECMRILYDWADYNRVWVETI